MFDIVKVDRTRGESIEELGTKRKYWLTDEKNVRRLFKAEDRGTGEDWAEKIACELADLLGLPHVQYELAIESNSDIPGVICESCSPTSWETVIGNQLLYDHDKNYPRETKQKYKLRAHTVHAVVNVLKDLKTPPVKIGFDPPAGIATALEVFIGYVLVDAWIANQDRHHQNWAALVDKDLRCLAPPRFRCGFI